MFFFPQREVRTGELYMEPMDVDRASCMEIDPALGSQALSSTSGQDDTKVQALILASAAPHPPTLSIRQPQQLCRERKIKGKAGRPYHLSISVQWRTVQPFPSLTHPPTIQ
ncbi:hypothetical protein M405DRAFT_860106 [Rhizopogon salebrosus TDB-379]|nr:hypothetical protein M405DRAFT_860106 [Rhizopogon salebrosus TDB-379]